MQYERDPNRPVSGVNLRDEPRERDRPSGNIAEDGFTVLRRRPQVAGITDCMEPERAERIEEMHREFPPMDDY